MKTKLIHITPKNMNQLFFGTQSHNGHTNEESRNKMKKILYSALQTELTERQRTCIIEHYLNGKKEKDIALEQNLNPSTVSRHITQAKKKLRHIASYYM
ncbi:MAG: sigma-70 family RNA polymerase sigma factor [Ruminococcus sp.]|nr:sigma-70 family RNA polymerase sigma factor [Ruminococcus sp.]